MITQSIILFALKVGLISYLAGKLLNRNVETTLGFGGGGDPSPPPTPAAPSETSREAISAQIEAVPRILESQREFGPQFTQLQLENLREFGPAFAEEALALSKEFGGRLSEQTRAEQEILAPERVAGSQAITDFIKQGPEELTPEEQRQFEQDVRSSQSVRGLAESGFGAQDEFAKLTALRQRLKDRFLDVSLSASGRLPAAGASTVSAAPQALGPGQLVENVSPSQIFGAQASNLGFQSSIFNTQQEAATERRGQNLAFVSDVIGGIAGGVGSYTGAGGTFR